LAPGILKPELFAQWKGQASTLNEWCRFFILASTSSSQEEPAFKATLEAKELFAMHAAAFRTPSTQRKQCPVDIQNVLNISPYHHVLTEGVKHWGIYCGHQAKTNPGLSKHSMNFTQVWKQPVPPSSS
jgi:hypothetical protein